ncbi:MAG: hypothetical protein JSU74_10000 [Candidatus Zixiibacteriota bacterium]|nr:MAG: hypothetical protein JSU74_10000 [candidate division Zixibacteria bacterium]
MQKRKLRYLTADDVRRSLPMIDAIAAMREAFVHLSSRQAIVPQRIHTEIHEHSATALFMPVYLSYTGKIGLKFVTVSEDNPSRGLPLIHATVLVADASSGVPLAVMDGSYLTALRTGAASGLATDLLARPDARCAAIFGAGTQGRTQLEAVCAVRKIEHAFVIDIDHDRAQTFAREMSEYLSIEVDVVDVAEALRAADVICTATTSAVPVFAHNQLKVGVHINGVGSYKPDQAEIPTDTIAGSKLVVDSKEGCLREAGDIILPLNKGTINEAHIHGEIGQIVAGERPGRESDTEITVFKSVGNAVQDLAAADRVLARASELGLGSEIEL